MALATAITALCSARCVNSSLPSIYFLLASLLPLQTRAALSIESARSIQQAWRSPDDLLKIKQGGPADPLIPTLQYTLGIHQNVRFASPEILSSAILNIKHRYSCPQAFPIIHGHGYLFREVHQFKHKLSQKVRHDDASNIINHGPCPYSLQSHRCRNDGVKLTTSIRLLNEGRASPVKPLQSNLQVYPIITEELGIPTVKYVPRSAYMSHMKTLLRSSYYLHPYLLYMPNSVFDPQCIYLFCFYHLFLSFFPSTLGLSSIYGGQLTFLALVNAFPAVKAERHRFLAYLLVLTQTPIYKDGGVNIDFVRMANELLLLAKKYPFLRSQFFTNLWTALIKFLVMFDSSAMARTPYETSQFLIQSFISLYLKSEEDHRQFLNVLWALARGHPGILDAFFDKSDAKAEDHYETALAPLEPCIGTLGPFYYSFLAQPEQPVELYFKTRRTSIPKEVIGGSPDGSCGDDKICGPACDNVGNPENPVTNGHIRVSETQNSKNYQIALPPAEPPFRLFDAAQTALFLLMLLRYEPTYPESSLFGPSSMSRSVNHFFVSYNRPFFLSIIAQYKWVDSIGKSFQKTCAYPTALYEMINILNVLLDPTFEEGQSENEDATQPDSTANSPFMAEETHLNLLNALQRLIAAFSLHPVRVEAHYASEYDGAIFITFESPLNLTVMIEYTKSNLKYQIIPTKDPLKPLTHIKEHTENIEKNRTAQLSPETQEYPKLVRILRERTINAYAQFTHHIQQRASRWSHHVAWPETSVNQPELPLHRSKELSQQRTLKILQKQLYKAGRTSAAQSQIDHINNNIRSLISTWHETRAQYQPERARLAELKEEPPREAQYSPTLSVADYKGSFLKSFIEIQDLQNYSSINSYHHSVYTQLLQTDTNTFFSYAYCFGALTNDKIFTELLTAIASLFGDLRGPSLTIGSRPVPQSSPAEESSLNCSGNADFALPLPLIAMLSNLLTNLPITSPGDVALKYLVFIFHLLPYSRMKELRFLLTGNFLIERTVRLFAKLPSPSTLAAFHQTYSEALSSLCAQRKDLAKLIEKAVRDCRAARENLQNADFYKTG